MKKLLGMALWLITSWGAMYVGLVALGYDVYTSQFFISNFAGLINPLKIAIGVSGLLSMLMFFMAAFSPSGACKCGCHEKPMA